MCRNIFVPTMARVGESDSQLALGNYSYDTNETYIPADEDPSLSLAAPIFMICAVIVGTLGNGGLIYIVLRNRDMRNIPNLLILNLSVGDFLYLALNVPFYIANYLVGSFAWNFGLCRFVNALQFISQGVSVFTLTALSTDRFYAIARPLQQRQSNSTRRTIGLAAGIWVLSTVFAIPAVAFTTTKHGGCGLPYQSVQTKVYYVILFVGLYLIPLVVISVFYTLTAVALLHGSFKLESRVRQGGNEKRMRSRTRLAMIILIAAVCFAICWLPFYLFVLWFEFGFDPVVFGKPAMYCLFDMHYLLPILGSCLNPIILFVMSSNYRLHLRSLFTCSSCSPTVAKRQLTSARSWTMMSLRNTSYSRSPTSVTELPRSNSHLSQLN
ncbi:bombesin receptor subtype-3-like [Diadema antillarum]|uniref:bombesin receptor subtype-3-like n=1 Tax=Diadema antillarum TaxID=105358 RepID=UPI003A83F167